MIFFLIWILVNTTMANAGGVCGVCGKPISDKGSYQSNGYPSWFPSSSYDKINLGYPSMNQYPGTHHHHEHHQPASGGYPSALGYQPPVDGSFYVADKGHQGYPAYNGDKDGFYDTGFKGYHNSWSEKGNGEYPVMSSGQLQGMNSGYDRVDYLDDDRVDTYARRVYKGYPSYSNGHYNINRVKKQSANSTDEKTR